MRITNKMMTNNALYNINNNKNLLSNYYLKTPSLRHFGGGRVFVSSITKRIEGHGSPTVFELHFPEEPVIMKSTSRI